MSITIIIDTPSGIKGGLASKLDKKAEPTAPVDSGLQAEMAELVAKFVTRPTMDDVQSATVLEAAVEFMQRLYRGKKFKEYKEFYDKLEPHMDQDARDRFRSVMGEVVK